MSIRPIHPNAVRLGDELQNLGVVVSAQTIGDFRAFVIECGDGTKLDLDVRLTDSEGQPAKVSIVEGRRRRTRTARTIRRPRLHVVR